MRKRDQIANQLSYQVWDVMRNNIYWQLYVFFGEDIHNTLRDELWLELQELLYDRIRSNLENHISKKEKN